ncbi:MAG: 4Fe-4S dicluster domain-containing protein [Promethearchaeota archaeon]|jgi:ferredoxin
MTVSKKDVEVLFKKMMSDLEGFTKTDEIYQEDMKDFDGLIKLQWVMCGMLGYQIFGKDSYSYKFGEKLDDPSVTFEMTDEMLASKFLKCEPFEFSYASIEGGIELSYVEGWKVLENDKGKSDRTKITRPFLTIQINPKAGLHPFVFSKLPMFREWTKKRTEGAKEYGSYIPINQSLGTYETLILPVKVFKHFIDKASNIVVRDCPCRVHNECENHEISLGCMMMGDSTFDMAMPKDNKGRVVSKEEALEHVKLSIENGLVPVLGRSNMEAEGYDVKDTEHFLSCCFCCTCCCINGKVLSETSVDLNRLYQRIEGLTIEVNPEKCVGCGECLEVCIFKGREIVDGKAKVNQKRCLGCGRCGAVCPQGATSIKFTDPNCVDDLIKKLEDHVDVTPQTP